MNDFKKKINKLFTLLRQNNIFAQKNYACCRSCAWWDFDDPYKNGYFVFTITQHKKDYLEWLQYIYGKYPPTIYEYISQCWLQYKQENEAEAICLLP